MQFYHCFSFRLNRVFGFGNLYITELSSGYFLSRVSGLQSELMAEIIEAVHLLNKLEGAARYAGLLLAPAEGFGLQPRPSADSFFCPSGKKKSFYVCFGPNFGYFW